MTATDQTEKLSEVTSFVKEAGRQCRRTRKVLKANASKEKQVCHTERPICLTLKDVFISQSYFATLDTRTKVVQFNPFTPEPSIITRVDTTCDVISFNGQGQLCPLTCAE